MPCTADGMGSSGSGTMQGFGNTAFTSNSKYTGEFCTIFIVDC